MTVYEDHALPGYRFEIGSADEFTAADLAEIEKLVNSRRQVDPMALHDHLPEACIIAIARYERRIVAVCVLKGVRNGYNCSIQCKSGFALKAGVPELGYTATDVRHEGRHLSRRLHDEVLKRVTGDVFATVRMPNTTVHGMLERRGFHHEGREWRGDGDNKVGLWFRKKPT